MSEATVSELVLKIDAKKAEPTAKRVNQLTGEMKQKGDGASGSFGKLSGKLTAFGKVAGTVAGAAMLGGVVSGLTSAIARSKEFGAAMAEVSTLLDDTSGLPKLEAGIRRISRQFAGDITTNAKAAYSIISAGASDTAETLKLLEVSNQLALGGVTDIATAADGLTSALNAYGEEAEKAIDFSDAMFVAMKQGKTTIGELARNLGSTAPLAASLNVPFSELLASVSAITKGGVGTAEAFTQVRAILTAMIKPSKEAADIAGELGIELGAAAIEGEGLNATLRTMVEASDGNVEQLGRMLGSVEAVNGALGLTASNGDSVNQILGEMDRRAGSTAESARKMENSLEFKWDKLKANFRSLGDSIVSYLEAPIISAIDWINRLLEKLTGFFTYLSNPGSFFSRSALFGGTGNAVSPGAGGSSFSNGTRNIDRAFQDSYQGSLGGGTRNATSLNGLRSDVRQLSGQISGPIVDAIERNRLASGLAYR